MSRKQPADIAASIHQRLLNISHERGEDNNLTLTRYAGERLLYRISKSRYADRFVLKGATLFSIWTDKPYRPTKDLDFLGLSEESEIELRKIFTDVCKVRVVPDGMEFNPDSMEIFEIREDQEYHGQRVKLKAKLGSAEISVQADIGFGDVVTPEAEEVEYPSTLPNIPSPRIRAYPRESVISEKFQAMIYLGMPNSRMKDFFDIYIMAKQFPFDGSVLARAISATFERRNTAIPSDIPLALSNEFAEDIGKRNQWKAFLSKNGLEENDVELPEIIDFLRNFLMPPSIAAQKQVSFNKSWTIAGHWKD